MYIGTDRLLYAFMYGVIVRKCFVKIEGGYLFIRIFNSRIRMIIII